MFDKDPVAKMFRKAERCLENEKYMEAKDAYLKCLALEPDNLNALNNLAQLYNMLGESQKAEGYNEMLLNECDRQLQNNQNETLLILKINALISLHRIDELKKPLDELLDVNPKNMVGLFHKAHLLEISNQNGKAVEYLDRILEEMPYNIAGLLSKGRNLVEMNEFDRAEECYNLVFKIETKNVTAMHLKSKMLKKKLNMVITPHDFMKKAIDCWEMENFKSSEQFFKRAIEIGPNYDEIWFAQGELFIRMGRIGDAISSFEEAFKLNPESGGIEKHEKFFKMLNRMRWVNEVLGYEK